MARAEEQHWWYRGLRDVMGRCLLRPGLGLPEHPKVLDAGCGTGENLRFLHQLLAPSYLGGFDAAPEALTLARGKASFADVYEGDLCAPVLHEAQFDLITSLDVLYIPGVEKARAGLVQLVKSLRKGGLFLVNLPAYDWLYSEHDAAIHTTQRFTRTEVRRLLVELGLLPEVLTYRLCFLFPAVALSRLVRRPGRTASAPRSDLQRPPSAAVNAVLERVLRVENALIARGVSLPFGSSVFAVGRKRGS